MHQVSCDLTLLHLKLRFITHHLQLTSAAPSGHRAGRLDAVRTASDNLRKPGERIRFLYFNHSGPHGVARDRILDKNGHAVGMANSQPLTRHILDKDCYFIIFFHEIYFVPSLPASFSDATYRNFRFCLLCSFVSCFILRRDILISAAFSDIGFKQLVIPQPPFLVSGVFQKLSHGFHLCIHIIRQA